MALNSNALISLEDLKKYLGIAQDDTSKDFTLEVYINGISDYIQGTGNTILKTDYVEKYQGTGTQELVLKHKPINSVSKLTNSASDVTDYEILKSAGILYKDYGWGLSGSTSPMMHDRINKVYKTIEIEYNAGYENTPGDLLMVITAMIKNQYELDTSGTLKSYSISDVKKTWRDEVKKLSPAYQSILFKYKGINV
jgi:hypothetical protein